MSLARVRTAVAPLLAEPRISSEQISQRVQGHVLTVLDTRGEWVKVRGDDEYEGWTHRGYLSEGADSVSGVRWRAVGLTREGSIVDTARVAFVGTPYQWGGITPWGADCSGFVQSVFAVHGIALPRDAYQQALVGQDASGRGAGELLFFSERDDGRITHVAIALGPQEFAHVALGRGGHAIEDRDSTDPYVVRLMSYYRFSRTVA